MIEKIKSYVAEGLLGDKIVWVIYIAFFLISTLEVYSSTSLLVRDGAYYAPILGHVIKGLAGVLALLVVHRMPPKMFRYFILLWVASIGFLIWAHFSSSINDANRWVNLGFIQFQPSELARLAVIVTVAKMLTLYRDEQGRPTLITFILCAVIAGVPLLFIVTENYSTTALLGITVFIMMAVAKMPRKYLLWVAGSVAGVIGLIVIIATVLPKDTIASVGVLKRINIAITRLSEKNPLPADPNLFEITDENNQRTHATIAIANAAPLGLGLGPGNSIQRDFLPQAFSDFIFAIIVEEFGLLGALVVIGLYFWLLARILSIARHTKSSFQQYILVGIGTIITLQAMINMGVSVGIFPITGQPLPFISRGGTSIVFNSIYIGLILCISRYAVATKAEAEGNEELSENKKLLLEDLQEVIEEEKAQV